MADAEIPEELRAWPGHIGNWGRWPNDRGTLNLITPEVTRRGVAASRSGRAIACARETQARDPVYGWPGVTHEMSFIGTPYLRKDVQAAFDTVSIHAHGMFNTHIDAFSHVGFKGYAFNGRRFEDVIDMETGAKMQDARDLQGIVTRGVFIDVARARGVPGLPPEDSVYPEDLAPALERVRPGDALVIRTGVTLTHGIAPKEGEDRHGTIAGLHIDCIDPIARAGVSVLASDSPSDTFPTPIPDLCLSPVHRLCLVFWGMPLVHNMDLEELGRVCAAEGRDDFLFMVSALNIPHATGTLCTPVAVL
jgi:kynurenine formamidase